MSVYVSFILTHTYYAYPRNYTQIYNNNLVAESLVKLGLTYMILMIGGMILSF